MNIIQLLHHWRACATALQGNETHWLHLCAVAAWGNPVTAELLATDLRRTSRSVWDQLQALADSKLIERVAGTGKTIDGRRYGKTHWQLTTLGAALLQEAERRAR